MSGRKDLKYIKYNNCAATYGICQNFDDAASNDFAIVLMAQQLAVSNVIVD
jgi:hypothetical protein